MTEVAAYRGLFPTTRNPCSMDSDWANEAQHTWVCPGCGEPRPGVKQVDVKLQNSPGNVAMNLVMLGGVGLARRDFLMQLGETNVGRDLYLGKVFDSRNKLLQEWVSYHWRKKIIVRGSQHVTQNGRCPVCGRARYFAVGRQYLYPQPDPDVAIFGAGSGRLVVRKALTKSISEKKWRGVEIVDLPVLAQPLDGLGDFERKIA